MTEEKRLSGRLISEPLYLTGGGEEREELKLPAVEERGRRRSQEFTNLRLKFIEHGEEGKSVKMSARPSVILPTERSTFKNLPSITTQGRGAVRKIFFSQNVTYSMAGRSDTLLARPSANSKRKWDQQEGLESKRRCGQ